MLTVPDSGVPEESANAPHVIPSLAFRFLVAIDIEGFSRRSTAEQVKLHDDLARAMSEAAASAGLERKFWYRQPRGDGELAVLPADTSGLSLVADYPRSLASVLAEVNRSADQDSRLRIRIAVHHGTVYPGLFGPVSNGPITVCRLVDAQVLRQMLRQQNDLNVALIVSAAVYDEIVKSRFTELDPKSFRRASIKVKGYCCTGYLYAVNQGGAQLRQGLPVTTPARPRWHRLPRLHARAVTIASCGS